MSRNLPLVKTTGLGEGKTNSPQSDADEVCDMPPAPSIGVHEQGSIAKHVEADDPSEMYLARGTVATISCCCRPEASTEHPTIANI